MYTSSNQESFPFPFTPSAPFFHTLTHTHTLFFPSPTNILTPSLKGLLVI